MMWRSAAFGVVLAGTPVVAQGNDLAFYWGGTISTGYVSRGIIYNEDLYVGPWFEVWYGSFYAGAYLGNVDDFFVFDAYSSSNGVYIGYSGSAGPVSYDASLYYYIYEGAGDTSPDYLELILEASVAPSDSTRLTFDVAIDDEYDSLIPSMRLDYYTPLEGLTVGVEYGNANTNYGDWDYWTVDASYAVADNVSLGLAWHHSTYEFNSPDANFNYENPASLVVASVNFSF